MKMMASALLAAAFMWQQVPPSISNADALYRAGEFRSAAVAYRNALRLDLKNETAWVGLIRSLLLSNMVQEAHQAALEAADLLPSSGAVLAALGDVQFRMADFLNATLTFDHATKLESCSARGHLGLAKVYASDFQRKTSRLHAEKAYGCDPEDPEVLDFYAGGLRAAERALLLKKYLQKATAEPPERIEFIRNLIALLETIGDRKTWVLRETPGRARLKLEPHAKRGQEGYLLKAVINGRKTVDLRLDTAAHGLLLDRKLASQLGVEGISRSNVVGIGGEQKLDASFGLASSIRFGNVEFRDCVINVAEGSHLGEVQGVVGTDVFKQFLITLNLPGKELQLEPLPPINGRSFDDPDEWDQLDRTQIPELVGFERVRMWGHLLMDTLVGGKARGYFYLDTGAASSFISPELGRRVTALRPTDVRVRGISGDAKEVYEARGLTLRVGRYEQFNERILAISLQELSNTLGLEISGLLGHPLLSRLVITIDYRDGLVRLSK